MPLASSRRYKILPGILMVLASTGLLAGWVRSASTRSIPAFDHVFYLYLVYHWSEVCRR